MAGKYVVFRLGQERLGIPIHAVERILPIAPLSKVPKSPKGMVGVFSYQGEAIAVIDAATHFELKVEAQNQHFLIINTETGRFGLQVEAVAKIVDFITDDIDRDSHWLNRIDQDLIVGVGKQRDGLCLLLKPEAIVPASLKLAA